MSDLPARRLRVVLGEGERLFPTPLGVTPTSATVFGGGAVAHVFAAS